MIEEDDKKNIFLKSKVISHKFVIGKHELWLYYKNNLTQEEKISSYNIDYKQWKDIIDIFFRKIFDKIIYDGYVYVIGNHMGTLFISREKIGYEILEDGRVKIVGAKVDWWNTYKLWKKDEEAKKKKEVIYFLNEHTDGYKLNFEWNKFACNAENKKGYRLIISKRIRKELYNAAFAHKLPKDYCISTRFKERKMLPNKRKNIVWNNAKKKMILQEI